MSVNEYYASVIVPCSKMGDHTARKQRKLSFFFCLLGADALLGGEASKYSNLCELCAGTGADKCSKDDTKNKYADYHGAFRCMGDKEGDVAFVKYTTTQEMVDAGGYGAVEDYEYLCKDGTRKSKTLFNK